MKLRKIKQLLNILTEIEQLDKIIDALSPVDNEDGHRTNPKIIMSVAGVSESISGHKLSEFIRKALISYRSKTIELLEKVEIDEPVVDEELKNKYNEIKED